MLQKIRLRKLMRQLLLLILPFALFSCTSATVQHKIESGNWFAVGEYDASNGFVQKSENKLNRMSATYGENKVDYDAYLAGYEEALLIYCEPENAFLLGVTGKPYHNICDRFPRGWIFYQDWLSGRESQAGSM